MTYSCMRITGIQQLRGRQNTTYEPATDTFSLVLPASQPLYVKDAHAAVCHDVAGSVRS